MAHRYLHRRRHFESDLNFKGGQFFFPDEVRYQTSRIIAQNMFNGRFYEAGIIATRSAEHLGFKLIGVIPALLEIVFGENAAVPALFFSFCSLACIYVVWLIALRLGADEREAFLACLMMAGSNAFFYYSRHLLPYDLAMIFGLSAFYLAVSGEPVLRKSILTGFLAFLTFVSYNGYWTIGAFALVVNVALPEQLSASRISKGILSGLGFIAPFGLVLLAGNLFGNDLWSSYVEFSGKINQGVFSEGWSLPFAYLWASEHSLLILWLIAIVSSIYALPERHPKRILIFLAGIFTIYGCFVLFSVVFGKFVVYGRLVRQLIPFLALTGAYFLEMILKRQLEGNRRGRVAYAAVILVMLLQFGLNFLDVFQLKYPRDFARQVQERYPDFKMNATDMTYTSPDVIQVNSYQAIYIKYIYPFPNPVARNKTDFLMSARHPQQYVPYLYEGFTPGQRSVFLNTDITMGVIRLEP